MLEVWTNMGKSVKGPEPFGMMLPEVTISRSETIILFTMCSEKIYIYSSWLDKAPIPEV